MKFAPQPKFPIIVRRSPTQYLDIGPRNRFVSYPNRHAALLDQRINQMKSRAMRSRVLTCNPWFYHWPLYFQQNTRRPNLSQLRFREGIQPNPNPTHLVSNVCVFSTEVLRVPVKISQVSDYIRCPTGRTILAKSYHPFNFRLTSSINAAKIRLSEMITSPPKLRKIASYS